MHYCQAELFNFSRSSYQHTPIFFMNYFMSSIFSTFPFLSSLYLQPLLELCIPFAFPTAVVITLWVWSYSHFREEILHCVVAQIVAHFAKL